MAQAPRPLQFAPLALAALLAGASALAQTPPAPTAQPAPDSAEARAALDAELFYELLVGEMSAGSGDAASGSALVLDAARRSGDARLYRRATELALQSRSGEAALIAVRAWQQAWPDSRDANRFLLRILVSLNRISETALPLRQELALSPAAERIPILHALPHLFARTSDKALAARTVERALQDTLADKVLAPIAWTNIGRMRLAAGDKDGALAALRQAQQIDPGNDAAATLALQLVEEGIADAEPALAAYLAGNALPEVRLAYARWLIDVQRPDAARPQVDRVARSHPDIAQTWLLQASLRLQAGLLDEAQAALERFTQLIDALPADQRPERALTQAYLMQAQVAEKRGDYALAERWLARITSTDARLSVQARRAALLARQGRLEEALALVRAAPASDPDDERQKLQSEARILDLAGESARAYDALTRAATLAPEDNDLAYELAMLAEKIGRTADGEQILRAILARKSDHHHALNALGYSLADRGANLQEARTLIARALAQAPEDPYITDSLGWVEFRLGNHARAQQLLEEAFRKKPDAEIAAHLGEVLWALGRQERARTVWSEGLRIDKDNRTLRATLKRLGVTP